MPVCAGVYVLLTSVMIDLCVCAGVYVLLTSVVTELCMCRCVCVADLGGD